MILIDNTWVYKVLFTKPVVEVVLPVDVILVTRWGFFIVNLFIRLGGTANGLCLCTYVIALQKGNS